MANIKIIDHGAADWDEIENANFAAMNADTGWVELPLINGFTAYTDIGPTMIRKIGSIVFMQLSITKLTQNTNFLILPKQFIPKRNFSTVKRGTIGNIFALTVGADGKAWLESKVTGTFSTDDYVGDMIVWTVD